MLGILKAELDVLWELGRNLVLAWCPRQDAIDVIVLPHFRLGAAHGVKMDKRPQAQSFFQTLVSGTKRLPVRDFKRAVKMLEAQTVRIPLPGLRDLDGRKRLSEIEGLIQRYGVSFHESKAVALFDIVGFSKISAFEQLAQLNSLSYSCNAAQSKFGLSSSRFDFARSSVGDGFYIWNRDPGVNANIDLYSYVHLILADNALARQHSGWAAAGIPLLKTAFHVGSYYEFFQTDGLQPTAATYIVGDVTIEVARLIEKVVPGQILIGDFRMTEGANGQTLDTLEFIEKVQPHASSLRGLKLSGQEIQEIRCYLTGQPKGGGGFSVRGFKIIDKHGFDRVAYNAKLNIYRRRGEPIYLGLPDISLKAFLRQADVEPAELSAEVES